MATLKTNSAQSPATASPTSTRLTPSEIALLRAELKRDLAKLREMSQAQPPATALMPSPGPKLVTSPASGRLTPSEIESLRQKCAAAKAWAQHMLAKERQAK